MMTPFTVVCKKKRCELNVCNWKQSFLECVVVKRCSSILPSIRTVDPLLMKRAVRREYEAL